MGLLTKKKGGLVWLLAPSLFVLGEVVSFCLASWLLAVPMGLVSLWCLSLMTAVDVWRSLVGG